VPEVASLEVLNGHLQGRRVADRGERTRGKAASKEELLKEDQAAFLPLPKRAFESRRVDHRTADSQPLVRFDDNDYSVPVQYAHRNVTFVATVHDKTQHRWKPKAKATASQTPNVAANPLDSPSAPGIPPQAARRLHPIQIANPEYSPPPAPPFSIRLNKLRAVQKLCTRTVRRKPDRKRGTRMNACPVDGWKARLSTGHFGAA